MSIVLKIDGVSKVFKLGFIPKRTVALDNVSLEVRKGEIFIDGSAAFFFRGDQSRSAASMRRTLRGRYAQFECDAGRIESPIRVDQQRSDNITRSPF